MSTKISQLTSATDITASDLMQIVDVEDGVMAPSGTNKKITAQLLADDLAGIVSAGSIATSKLASGALPSGVTVSSTNIVNGTIVDADINASAAISLSKLQTGALPSGITIASGNIVNGTIIDDDINASAAIAGSKISPSFTTNSSVTVNSSSVALAITQSGDGSALSANGSRSQFLNDDSAVNLLISTASNDIQPSYIQLRKYRGTHSSPEAVQSGDALGSNVYYGYDGNSLEAVAFFGATVDGTVSDGIIPTRFGFSTENSSGVLSEKMRITSAGDVGIGATSPSSRLHVAGDLTMSSATVATSATAGTNGDVPAQVAGYLVVSINGTARKIPYYA